MSANLSPIQNRIISKLKNAKMLRYSELQQEGVPNDLFNYHLQFLVKKELVDRKEDGYSLSESGIRLVADPIPVTAHDAITSLFKVNVITIVSRMQNGKLEIPGFDMNNIEERKKLGLQARAISKSISGNMSEEDISRASMDIFFKSGMVFKNWIPKLVETRFGKLQNSNEYYDKDSYDIGKVRLFWHVFMQHAGLRFSAIRNIMKVNDKGMLELENLYTHYKEDYQKRTGKEFNMSKAAFNDMVVRNIKNQYREIILLFSMAALFMSMGMIAPPEDKHQQAIFNTTKRGISQMINELSFYYVPSNWQQLFSQGIFPALSTLDDAEKFITNLSAQITGHDFKPSTEGAEAVRKAAQPVKYLFKMAPGFRQGINYMAVFSPDLAKDMDISAPPSQNYR